MSLSTLAASAARPAITREPLLDDAGGAGGEAPASEKFGKLVEYIPTEIVTLFLAAMAAREALAAWANVTPMDLYWIAVITTPVLFVVIFAGTLRQAGKKIFEKGTPVPWWPMVAATIAFAAWGLVVPEVVPSEEAYVAPLLALLATIVTVLLPVIGRVFEKPAAP